ncbi:MAG TPA: cupin domain-containing protein [Gemmataceae bacterium]|jgi:quercetin dioxygenase-like cupin family protein|nr:cupin domain-containing protein [Gemmataceae bacterium]
MSRYFPSPAECGHHTIFGNIPARTYAGEHLQLSLVEIPPDGIVEWHAHVNEQMGMVVTGRALFHIGDEVRELGPGDMYLMPSNVKHKVIPVGGPVRALDVFCPVRDEYR